VTRKALAMMLPLAMLVLVTCGSEPNQSEEAAPAPETAGAGAYGQGGAEAGGTAPGAVKVVDYTFSPAEVKIPVGQTITWTFADEAGHDVVSTEGTFKSEVLGSGGTYSFTFSRAGTFDYFCSIHPSMKGKVIVG
jgi:plastocyanin